MNNSKEILHAECLNRISQSFLKNIEKPLGENTLLLEYTRIDYSKIKKILIIQFTAFGDAVITSNLTDILKKYFHVSILVLDSYSEVFEGMEKITIANAILTSGNAQLIIENFNNLANRINNEKFDLIINLHPSLYSAYFCNLLDRKFFLGQIFDFNSNFIKAYSDYSYYYRFFGEYFRQLIKGSRVKSHLPLQDIYFFLSQVPLDFFKQQNLAALELECLKKKQIVITPGGKWKSKLWPQNNFICLIDEILKYSSDIKILITGDASEKQLIENIYNGCADKSKIEIFSGTLSISNLISTIRESALLISGDTSVLHIAANVSTPAIILISSTITCPAGNSIVIFADAECSGCLKPECSSGKNCITKIQPLTVFYFAKLFIDNNFVFEKTIRDVNEKYDFKHKIFYSRKRKNFINFLKPLAQKTEINKNTVFDAVYFCAVYSLLVCFEHNDEETMKKSAEEINAILSDYYNFTDNGDKEYVKNLFDSILSEISDIYDKLNFLLKESIRVKENNSDKIFQLSDEFEKSFSNSKIYKLILKPFDVIMFEPPEVNTEIKYLLKKFKQSIAAKKQFAEILKKLFWKRGEL